MALPEEASLWAGKDRTKAMPKKDAQRRGAPKEGEPVRWARYGEAKRHEGRTYRGMRVGGVHRWSYPDGEWTERKVAPDRWEVTFTSLKRRKRRAPARSGAETGSGYHWLIVAHQWVEKLDANTYSTQMEGAKYLVAFRKPGWPVWNTQFRNAKRHARERTIAALEAEIARLKAMDDAAFEDPHDAKALPALAATAAAPAISKEAEAGGPAPDVPVDAVARSGGRRRARPLRPTARRRGRAAKPAPSPTRR